MYNVRNILDDLLYLGCSDRRLQLFESAYPVADGVSYNSYLLKDEKQNKVSVVSENTRGAKFAKLDYKVIEENKNRTKVAINLYTGRAHQIRVQFSSRGHALIGDVKYGKIKADRVLLWAYEVEFKHPVKDEIMKFTLLPDEKYYKI